MIQFAMATKVEIIQKQTIKPSSPTPPHLKTLSLSLLDQFTPVTYTPLLLFYPQTAGDSSDHFSDKIRKSLSETLTVFYPLAGRLHDNTSVDCDDQGAEFIEAKINYLLSDVLKNPEACVLSQFLPKAIESPEAATGNLLLVQATSFDCGGLAIGVCISHKIADAATLATFIRCWSSISYNKQPNQTGPKPASPVFMGASIFPPVNISIPKVDSIELKQNRCVTTRFVFTVSKINELRTRVTTTTVPNPTRVEAVSGLLWKSAMSALRTRRGYSRPSIWSMAVDLRKRLLNPLPENFAGNCLGNIAPRTVDGGHELDIKEVVGNIRTEMEGFKENYVKKLEGERALQAICEISKEFGNWAMSDELDFYICSSWCRFELYDADLGWGKPVWVSHTSTTVKNVAVLMDMRDGEGVEAWLTLEEDDMKFVESNEELLQFAAVNPSVS